MEEKLIYACVHLDDDDDDDDDQVPVPWYHIYTVIYTNSSILYFMGF